MDEIIYCHKIQFHFYFFLQKNLITNKRSNFWDFSDVVVVVTVIIAFIAENATLSHFILIIIILLWKAYSPINWFLVSLFHPLSFLALLFFETHNTQKKLFVLNQFYDGFKLRIGLGMKYIKVLSRRRKKWLIIWHLLACSNRLNSTHLDNGTWIKLWNCFD